mgnify:CR=1 FL=1
MKPPAINTRSSRIYNSESGAKRFWLRQPSVTLHRSTGKCQASKIEEALKIWWYRCGLVVLAAGLIGLLWWILQAPLPNPVFGGFAALGLGVALALFIVSFWHH